MGAYFCPINDDPRTKQQIRSVQSKKKIGMILIIINLMKFKKIQKNTYIELFHVVMWFTRKIKIMKEFH